MDLPATPDHLQGVGGGPAPFFQAVERMTPQVTRLDIGQLLDLKIVWGLLDVHIIHLSSDRRPGSSLFVTLPKNICLTAYNLIKLSFQWERFQHIIYCRGESNSGADDERCGEHR